jgi:hypothetical protein
LKDEFTRQLETLVRKGYPRVAGLAPSDFRANIEPLAARLETIAIAAPDDEGHLPFVIVVKSGLVPANKSLPLVERAGKRGIIGMYPVQAAQFTPIESVSIPGGSAYLLVDIDRGKSTLNVAPDQALDTIQALRRSPLTIDEASQC